MGTLILIRHGKTKWTEQKRFAGWANAPLSTNGRQEALSAAKILKAKNVTFDVCYTSCLIRAKNTTQIIFDHLSLPQDEIQYRWLLNERHYGALQGELRGDMREKHSISEVLKWRNTYDAQPPKLTDDDPRWHKQLIEHSETPQHEQPRSESMEQAVIRTQKLWHKEITPALKSGKTVLIIAHTNSLRALTRSIEDLNDSQSAAFRIPTAAPRIYNLDENLKPMRVRDLTNNPMKKIQKLIAIGKMKTIGKMT